MSPPKTKKKSNLSVEERVKLAQDFERLIKLKDGLPHLYGQKFYAWAEKVWDSTNREAFLCAANQLGKSSIAIRKNIRLATDQSLWSKFWPGLAPNAKPNLFWYFYPTMPVAHTEFETKWEPLFLPRGEFRTHPHYGWEPEFEKGLISKIRFNSGVQIQFKAYSQKIKDLQTATVYHVTSDEELPVEFYPEVKARLNSTDGYFLMVFTATLGQLYWQQTMEPANKTEERHPDALKLQVSLYDSQFFTDGTPSHWTNEKIKRAIANCPTEAEIQRRVYGRFVKASGLMYEAFSIEKNMIDPHPIPKDWMIFAGVDIGTGGQSGHPAAIVFIAASPDLKQGRVFRAWRGDNIPTTAPDILEKYQELKKDLLITQQVYDHAAKDFFTFASRRGEAFMPADKSREAGIGLLNSLFKTRMLKIFRGDNELEKLVQELCSLGVDTPKRKAIDDLVDACRYTAQAIPWTFDGLELAEDAKITLARESMPVAIKKDNDFRREWFFEGKKPVDSIQEEFDFWNENYGGYEGD